jgi:YkoP domain
LREPRAYRCDLDVAPVLAFLIRQLDALLCRIYRIEEFTDDRDCLIRLATKRASTPIALSDGTRVLAGGLVGELHLWNRQVPRFASSGPTIGWARRAHRLMVYSLSRLADYVEHVPEMRRLQAFYADVPISPKQSMASVQRMAMRYGFELFPQRQTMWRFVHDPIESLLLRGLAYAFNPLALRRQAFLRRRQRIWIGRATLMLRYGAKGRSRD